MQKERRIVMKKIIFISNSMFGLYKFRKEVIEYYTLSYEVYIVAPDNDFSEYFDKIGCTIINYKMDNHGKNIFKNLVTIYQLYKIIKEIKPENILTYTIKPNLYIGVIRYFISFNFYPNITGLGTFYYEKSILSSIIYKIFRVTLKKSKAIFFQNENDLINFGNKLSSKLNKVLLPGSGVNLDYFEYNTYPKARHQNYIFISRIIKEKGIELFLMIAEKMKKKYTDLTFHVVGPADEEYLSLLEVFQEKGIIKYHGVLKDVRVLYKLSNCLIHPTYYPEGMSNVLLESCASGRPVITTNQPGCREVVNGKNGYLVKPNDFDDLFDKVNSFHNLSFEAKLIMSYEARKHVKMNFDRKLVINLIDKELIKIGKY